MATSLAAQLKKLAVPETQSLLTGDFKQASFLYDDLEAATFTKQHFYNIGVNGLLQLIAKDARFAEFEHNLFSQSSQSLQRYVQTSEVNQQLDATIEKFLLRLSSYMQLREAHKAMEWMVHRYNVHLRNVDAFMMCLLPYHDQQPFVMALQLIKMNSNQAARWRWLEPVKKGGTFLPRQTIVMHCKSATGFLGYMCDMLNRHVEANTDEETGLPSAPHLQRVVSFFAQTVLGVLAAGPPSESTVSTLLPVLTIALKSHALRDLQMCSYMILSQLFVQTDLAQPLLQSLLNVIAKNMQASLVRSALTVMIIMFQKQSISKLPKKAFRYLVRQPYLATVLQDLSKEAHTEPFLSPFLVTLTRRAMRESGGCNNGSTTGESTAGEDEDDNGVTTPPSLMGLLLQILGTIELKRNLVVDIVKEMLNYLTEDEGDSRMDLDDNAFVEGPLRLFKLIENKYSSFLDAAIEELSSEDKKIKQTARQMFQLSIESAKKNLHLDPAATVTVCLLHRHASVRQKAVETILKDPEILTDKSNIQSTLVLKLQDGSPEVVKELLREPVKLWSLFEDKSLLYSSLLSNITRMRMKQRNEVHGLLLQALCCVPENVGDETQMMALILSSLLVVNGEGVQLATSLLQSPFASRSKLLSHIRSAWLHQINDLSEKEIPNDLAVEIFLKLVECSSNFFLRDPSNIQDKLQVLYDCMPVTSQPAALGYIIMCIACAAIKKMNDEGLKVSLQRMLISTLAKMVNTKHLFTKKGDDSLGDASDPALTAACLLTVNGSGSLPYQVIRYIVQETRLHPVSNTLKASMFWSLSEKTMLPKSDSDWLHAVSTAINLLLELRQHGKKACVSLAEQAFGSVFKILTDKECVIKFLCMMWMSGASDGVTSAHKARLLQFSQVYIGSLAETERISLLKDTLPFVPCILILLSNKCERVREAAFTLLYLASSHGTPEQKSNSALVWLTTNILRFRQEITKDNFFLAQVIKTLLEQGEDSSASPPSPKKRRRSASKPPPHTAALTWLLDVVIDKNTPGIVQAGLLQVLTRLDTSDSFLPLVPTLKASLESLSSTHQSDKTNAAGNESYDSNKRLSLFDCESKIVELLLKRFTPTVAPVVDDTSGALSVLLSSLRCSYAERERGETVQMLALEQLGSKFVSALPSVSCKIVVGELLTLAATCGNAEAVRCGRKVIKHMSLDAGIVVDELKSVITKTSAVTVREAKRQRQTSLSNNETNNSRFDSLAWRRVTLLLEMLQTKKKLRAAVSIVPVAFQVLGRVLELAEEKSGEYLKQLLMGLINFICSRQWDEDEVKGEHLDMNLIVQCIRSSDDVHTHHQALLLLCSAAKIDPGLLLHNMMTVFTFMGANILRQDDEYSFHVIGRILDNVIPALIMACDERSKQKKQTPLSSAKKKTVSVAKNASASEVSTSGMMTVVLRVFVGAAPHIPSHRRLMLFERLLNVVGADQYLWIVMLLYLEAATSQNRVGPAGDASQGSGLGDEGLDEGKTNGPLSTSDLEFLTGLIERFSCSQLLGAFQNALAYVLALPEERPAGAPVSKSKTSVGLDDLSAEDMTIFSVPDHTAKQLRHFKFASVYALNHLVTCPHMVAQLSEESPASYLSDYQRFLETTLQWISQVTESLHRHAEETSRRYWKLLLHRSHDLLDTLVNLLPDSMFYEVVSGLMGHSLSLVQRRAMELLTTRLQQHKDGSSTQAQMSLLLPMISKLHIIASHCFNGVGKTSGDQLLNGQTALYSLKILCKIIGDKHHTDFMEVLQLCVDTLSAHSSNGVVSASAMQCIAEIVSASKAHAIPHLSLFMPLFVDQLKADTITQHDVLLLATITSLQKVIEAVPLFLSPFLKDIVMQLCLISSIVSSNSDSHKPVVAQKIKLICATIANTTPTRTFIPVMENSFLALEDKMARCAECAMTMLKDHIAKMAREDLTTFCQDLLKFFFMCFDIRLNYPEMEESDLDIVEGCVVEAFVTLVFKLSEAQFKPMLLQIYNWATDEESSPERTLFFYRLCNSLAEKLKSLFTLFAGHILKHSAKVLDETNKSKSKCRYFGKGKLARRKSCRLACYVVDCLQKTFAHDTEGFMTKERFDIVMQPLVDQLENQLGMTSVCEDRAVSHVVPCIASLAMAARDDSLWKDLNYQILLKTRHQDAQVRMWALSALDAFHKQLGEDFTQLVPEAIPFLAELMEDESDEVEKYTQKVLANMEVSVGENLQEYF